MVNTTQKQMSASIMTIRKECVMDRITQWNGSKYILPQGRTPDGQSWWRIIADRLAEYENNEERSDGMWIDTRDCVPLADGEYYTQNVLGRIMPMNYTSEGGWNTYRDEDGTLRGSGLISGDLYIARWYKISTPPDIPKEWYEEWYRKAVTECDTE